MRSPAAFKDVSPAVLRQAARTFRPVIRRQRRGIELAVALTLVTAILKLLQPWPIKIVLDRIVGPRTSGLWGLSPQGTIAAAALMTVGMAILQGIVSLGVTRTGARVARDLAMGIRRMVFEHLHRLAVPFHTSGRTGELLLRLMSDVKVVRDGLFTQWLRALGAAFTFLIMTVIMFILDPLLAAVAFLPAPIVLLVFPRTARRLREATRRQRKKQGSAAARAAESLRHIRLVKAYAAERRATDAFSRESRRGDKAGVEAARISAEMERTTDILTGIGLALVLLVGGYRVMSGAVTVGDLVVFLSYARSFYRPLGNVSNAGVRMGRVTAAAERMIEVFRMPPEDSSTGIDAPSFAGRINLNRVRYAYPNGPEALKGVSCDIPPGAIVTLVGPNGAGKSTVLSLLLRLIEPTDGEIRVDGEAIAAFKLSSYRERFAYVPQRVQLFSGTLKENILYGRPGASEQEVDEAARSALLDDVVARLPDGLDTALGEGGETLSGGEARRLMLARAAVRDARVLLLDEPLIGLDREAVQVVAQALRQVASGRTTIVVTHEAIAEFNPDVVLRLDAGRLVDVTQTGPDGESPDDPERISEIVVR